MEIERHIHQTWKDHSPPEELFKATWKNSWKELNPDWSYTLWTDEGISSFVAKEYPEFYPTWVGYPSQIMRVDAWRYLLLKSRGGLYVDLDFLCLAPLDDWLPTHLLFHCGDQGDGHFCNAFMWAPVPDLPFFAEIEAVLTERSRLPNVIQATGPHFLTDYAASRKPLTNLIDRSALYPLPWDASRACKICAGLTREELAVRYSDAKAMTFWSASWVTPIARKRPALRNHAKILIGICSCQENTERRQACRDTWLSRLPPSIETRFFVGGDFSDPENDVVVVDAPDSYPELPLKVRRFFQYALAHFEFDWLFKCDDDTYVVPERLREILGSEHDLVGDISLRLRGAPSGGAGYGLSRRLVEILAADDSLPSTGHEDLVFGHAAVNRRAKLHATSRLRYDNLDFPSVHNDLVSAHWCSPKHLHAIHRFYPHRLKETISISHPLWDDQVILYENGLFRRQATACAGYWFRESDGHVRLEWFEWGIETFSPRGLTVRKPVRARENTRQPIQTYLLVPKIEKTLYVELVGGMGNQMFQYAYGLALSRKLRMGLELIHHRPGRPFALGTFGLQLSQPPRGKCVRLYDGFTFSPKRPWPLLEEIHISQETKFIVSGYFQNERLFHGIAAELREKFRMSTASLVLRDTPTVGVHVRRGDFANHPLHDVCGRNYYLAAMSRMLEILPDASFLIFSDDPEWCEENLGNVKKTEIFTNPCDMEHFAALLNCDAFILSNSTFGWWAAWAANARWVVAPDRFLNGQEWNICPERWITISPDVS